MRNKLLVLICIPLCISLAGVTGSLADAHASEVEHEIGFYYTVQKGDSLWDISERFFDTPLKWPDLWEDNQHITNPHEIEPGTRVRIYRGTDAAQIKLPEKKKSETAEKEAPVETSEEQVPYLFFSPINRLGFVRNEPIRPSGVIFKTENDIELVSVGDLVFIRKDSPELFSLGKKFTAFRTINLKKLPKSIRFPGFQHYLTGVVEIISIEPDYAIAKVIKSYRTMHRNDQVIPFEKRSPEIPIEESEKGIEGHVIGSEERDKVFGDHSVAFIDKGSQDGIVPGQIYSLYMQRDVRVNPKKRKDTRMASFDIGTLFVLDTEKTTSTVFIMSAKEILTPKTRFRTPANEKK